MASNKVSKVSFAVHLTRNASVEEPRREAMPWNYINLLGVYNIRHIQSATTTEIKNHAMAMPKLPDELVTNGPNQDTIG